MSNQDYYELESLLSGIHGGSATNEDIRKYARISWHSLSENSLNPMTSYHLRFDSTVCKDEWVLWNRAYLSIPHVVTLTTNDNAPATMPNVCLKNPGTPLLYHDCQVEINGKTIFRSDYLGIKSGLDLLVQSSKVWQENEGELLNFAKDKDVSIKTGTHKQYMKFQKGLIVYSLADVAPNNFSADNGVGFRVINAQTYNGTDAAAAIAAGGVPAIYHPYFDSGDLTNIRLNSTAGIEAQNIANAPATAVKPLGAVSPAGDVRLHIQNNSGGPILINTVIPSSSLPQINGVAVSLPYGFRMTAVAEIANGAWGPVNIKFYNTTGATINLGQDIPALLLPYAYSGLDEGFTKRSSQLFVTTPYAVTANPRVATFTFTAITPLKYLHTFFDVIDIPLVNCQMRLTLNPSFNSAGFPNYCPIQCDYPDLANINLRYGASDNLLYYPTIEFRPETKMMVSRKMADKSLYFSYSFHDWNSFMFNAKTVAEINNKMTVHPTQKKPLKLWMMLYDQNVLTDATKYYTRNEPLASNNSITNFNILINDVNFFISELKTPYEVFKVFQQNLQGGGESTQTGSRINFSDYQKQYNIICVDLTRNPQYVETQFNTVDLKIRGTTSKTLDILCLVEYKRNVKIDLSNGCNVTVNDNPDEKRLKILSQLMI